MTASRLQLSKSFARTITTFVVAILLFVVSTVSTKAQNDALTPLASAPGVPNGSYGLSNIDTISPYNGRVNVHLSLLAQSGRGGAKSEMNMTWDTPSQWQVFKYSDANGNPAYYAGLSPYSLAANLHMGGIGLSG